MYSCLFLLGLLAGEFRLAAQALPAAPASSAPAPANPAKPIPAATAPAEEVVQLSPFQVEAGTDRGYQALNTLSGTRLNSKLEDLGSTYVYRIIDPRQIILSLNFDL